MTDLIFSTILEDFPEKLIEIFTDYENMQKLVTGKLRSKVLERVNDQTVIEEILKVPILDTQISQKSIHKKIEPNEIQTKIISGPLQGTIMKTLFEQIDSETKVIVHINLKLGLRYRLFGNIVKEIYMRHLSYVFNRINDLVLLTKGNSWKDSLLDNGTCLTVSKANLAPIKLYGWEYGDLHDVFVDESYGILPVKGKTIIDVGANIGDSSIYFALCGAQKVIALEPFPKNYEYAKKNIKANNLSERVHLSLEGLSGRAGNIQVDPNKIGIGSKLESVEGGMKIPITTLQNILKINKLDSALLKLDCEGCEYDAINLSSSNVLQKFSHIMLEFHNGYKSLKEKLEESNFKVTVNPNPNSKNKLSTIYAIQK